MPSPRGLQTTISSLIARPLATSTSLSSSAQRPIVVLLPIRTRRYTDSSSAKKPSGQAGVDAAINGPTPEQTAGKGPNEEQLPHISEEAAAISQIKGEEGPDVNQGTRVEDVLKRDKDLKGQLPKVMADALKKDSQAEKSKSAGVGGKREYSTFTKAHSTFATKAVPFGRRSFSTHATQRYSTATETSEASDAQQPLLPLSNDSLEVAQYKPATDEDDLSEFFEAAVSDVQRGSPYSSNGLVFQPMPVPTSKQANFRTRHESIVDQVTKLIMRSGKLGLAQRNMAAILNHLRTSPGPKRTSDPKGTLLASSPPLQDLPLDPVQYLTLAIDSVAPLFRLRSQKGLAGGGVALQIPVPLWQRQRRRTAILWILDSVEKKSRGGSLSPFARRFGEEIVAIVEGKSAVWEKRKAVHGLGVRARANLRITRR